MEVTRMDLGKHLGIKITFGTTQILKHKPHGRKTYEVAVVFWGEPTTVLNYKAFAKDRKTAILKVKRKFRKSVNKINKGGNHGSRKTN